MDEPVPALSRMPGPPSNAALKATSASPRTRTRVATPSATSTAARADCSASRPAPAAPTMAAAAGKATLAWAAARRAASAMMAPDAFSPAGFMADDGPSARPRTRASPSPMTAVVWEPPASTPRKSVAGLDGMDARWNEGRQESRRHRHHRAERHVPRPAEAPEPVQGGAGNDPAED